ncbi:unnamed protein product [Schistocephalus solidus]|uniref:PDZ domain-containing protein n=1 Tax=Schistocephalus solidus TaxID=70667 RepID=A0A183TAZ0_SCHSO|nr:unnamed protein product [Schistocephalus solidus]
MCYRTLSSSPPELGVMTEARKPEAGEDASGWRGRSRPLGMPPHLAQIPWSGRSIAVALGQQGVDAEDSDPLQNFRVRDPVLPSQIQYSAEASEMEVIQLPGVARVNGPGLCSVKEFRQDDGLVIIKFGVKVDTVVGTHGGLQSAEGLTGF